MEIIVSTSSRGPGAASGSQSRDRRVRTPSRIWPALAALSFLVAFLVAALAAAPRASAQTIDDVVRSHSGGCTTAGGEGLADQLVRAHLCMYPGAVTTFAPYPNITLGSSRVHPLAAVETRDALHAAADRGPLQVSSAFRTLSEQYLLYNEGGCGLAAVPGSSNHQSGVAVDLSNYSAALTRMTDAGCRHPYPGSDPVHFDCPGPDMRAESVLVFQRLWNANHPEDRIAEDGDYGPQTAARVGRSPAGGFPSDGCSVVPPTTWGAEFVAQSFPVAADPPIVMRPGEEIAGWIELRNVGPGTWDGNTRLGTTEPRDRASTFAGPDWLSASRPSAVSGTVAPGGTYRFTFTVRAPDAIGEHREHFGVVQEGVAWFGDPGQLGPPDAQLELRISVVAAEPPQDAGPIVADAGPLPEGDAGPDLETDAELALGDGGRAPLGHEPVGHELGGSCTCRTAGGGGSRGLATMALLACVVLAWRVRRARR